MQQQITINITNTPGIPDTGLNEFINSIGGVVSDNIGLFISVILLTLILATGIVLSRKHLLKTGKSKMGFLSLFLIPIAIFTITANSQTVDAAVSATFPNQTVNIEQGTTSVTITFNASVDSSTYTDGYDASPNLIAALPAGVSIQHNSQDITTAPGNIIAREYRTSSGADNGQIEYTITIPADAPVGNNYAIITLDYIVDDFIDYNYLADIITTNNITTMQGMTSLLCADADYDNTNNGANANNTITLTDVRNNQQYMVRKLADGKCWMINNLKLGSTTQTTPLTPADTNITSNWTLPQLDASTGAVTLSYNQPKAYASALGVSTTDITSSTFYGYHYNWCAATAGGTASGGSNTCTTSSVTPSDATTDICPINWHMPRGGDVFDASNEFANLTATMAGYPSNTDPTFTSDFDYSTTFSDNFQSGAAFNGTLAGYRGRPSWDAQGAGGGIHSSSHISGYSNSAFSLGFGPSDVRPAYINGRDYGFSVRCVLD